MKPRPLSVTIICWILIIGGSLSLIVRALTLHRPEIQIALHQSPFPPSVTLAITFAGVFIAIITGIYMLNGARWARNVYVFWSAAQILFAFITSVVSGATAAQLVFTFGLTFLGYAVLVTFLFRPGAREFFRSVTRESVI